MACAQRAAPADGRLHLPVVLDRPRHRRGVVRLRPDRPDRRAAVHRGDHAPAAGRAALGRDGGDPRPGAGAAARGRRGQLLQGRRAAAAGAAGAAGRRPPPRWSPPSTPRASRSTRTATSCRTCWSCAREVPGRRTGAARACTTTPTVARCRRSAAARTPSSAWRRCAAAGLDPVPFSVNPNHVIVAVNEASGLPALAARRRLDPVLFDLNAAGALQRAHPGHRDQLADRGRHRRAARARARW